MFTNITGVRVVRLHLHVVLFIFKKKFNSFIYLLYLFLNYVLYLINFRIWELL